MNGCVSTATAELVDTCCADAAKAATCRPVVRQAQCAGFVPQDNGGGGEACAWIQLTFNFDNLWQSLVTLTSEGPSPTALAAPAGALELRGRGEGGGPPSGGRGPR
jgi:hypothetical protein